MPISFGTSGLRGAEADFDAASVSAYVRAFLEHVDVRPGEEVFVGCDLRTSSPRISSIVLSVIAACGMRPVWAGVTPTPALAAFALARSAVALEVTGSHIPEQFNGIKFYRPDGEMLKSDEEPVRTRAAQLAEAEASAVVCDLPEPSPEVSAAYVQRFTSAFASDHLKGLRLGVYQHSAAGRDLLVEILTRLGADVVPFGRSDRFIPVDTEALEPESLQMCVEAISEFGLDVVVATDGDGDRPLLIARDGRQIGGDALGALAARALGISAIATPLTSTSAIEASSWFATVKRTRIGSTYVVEALAQMTDPAKAGFEANGGFLLGTDLPCAKGTLAALPTRDAVLPMLAVLGATIAQGRQLAGLVADLPARSMMAGRLKNVPQDTSAHLIAELARDGEIRKKLSPELADPKSIDQTDGVRFVLNDESVVHVRASGNAPELRLYVECQDADAAERTLERLLPALSGLIANR